MENSIPNASMPDFIYRNFLLVYFYGTAEITEHFFHSCSQKPNKSRQEEPAPLHETFNF